MHCMVEMPKAPECNSLVGSTVLFRCWLFWFLTVGFIKCMLTEVKFCCFCKVCVTISLCHAWFSHLGLVLPSLTDLTTWIIHSEPRTLAAWSSRRLPMPPCCNWFLSCFLIRGTPIWKSRGRVTDYFLLQPRTQKWRNFRYLGVNNFVISVKHATTEKKNTRNSRLCIFNVHFTRFSSKAQRYERKIKN